MQIRVSSEISNGPVILNVDCDMYSNNSQSIRDALCFFLDEEKGHEVAFVQFPQNFCNLTRNELYGGSLRVISEVGASLCLISLNILYFFCNFFFKIFPGGISG